MDRHASAPTQRSRRVACHVGSHRVSQGIGYNEPRRAAAAPRGPSRRGSAHVPSPPWPCVPDLHPRVLDDHRCGMGRRAQLRRSRRAVLHPAQRAGRARRHPRGDGRRLAAPVAAAPARTPRNIGLRPPPAGRARERGRRRGPQPGDARRRHAGHASSGAAAAGRHPGRRHDRRARLPPAGSRSRAAVPASQLQGQSGGASRPRHHDLRGMAARRQAGRGRRQPGYRRLTGSGFATLARRETARPRLRCGHGLLRRRLSRPA